MKKKYVVWIIMILIYSLFTYSGRVSKLILPQPHELILACRVLWEPVGYMAQSPVSVYLLSTLGKYALAVLIGGLIGIPLGFAKSYSEVLHDTMDPILNFFRAVPATNLYSLFMLAFGYGSNAQISMSAFRGILDHTAGSEEGVRNCPGDVIEAAMLDGANTWEIVRYVSSYLALPYIFATAKASLSISFVLVSVGEQMAGSNGLGTWIRNMHTAFRIPEMWMGIILSGIVGVLVNSLLERIRTHLITWE